MVVQNQLNHFVTDLYQPDHKPVEVLEGKISTNNLKAMALRTLEKVSYVALIAIIAVVFAVSYNLLALSGVAPLVLAGLILASPILVLAPIKFAQLAKQYSSIAENDERTLSKLRNIENWGSDEVDRFFLENQLDLNRLNLNALRQVNPEEPKKALLPLIAQYESLKEHALKIKRSCEEAPAKLEENFREKEERDGQPIDGAIKHKIRYENQCSNWQALELQAIPTVLNAATLLHLIENPTTTDMDVLPLSFDIPGIGTCAPRNYPERMFGKNNNPQNDDYFHFHPDLHRPALTHAEIEGLQMDPNLLKQRLFPR